MAENTHLTKEKLVRRVALHLGRYGIDPGKQTAEEWTKSHIDEWLKQSLTIAGKLGPSDGRKRTYVYTCLHYRRSLQLLRLYGEGRTSPAELHVQLFLRGYSGFSQALRDALLSEYQKFRAQLIALLRSNQFTNFMPLSEAKQRQIAKSIGLLDDRLQDFALPFEIHLGIIRLARSFDPNETSHMHSFPDASLLTFLRSIFGGMLDEGTEGERGTEIEKLIDYSCRETYEQARQFIMSIDSFAAMANEPGSSQGFSLLGNAIKQREFSTFLLVLALRMFSKPL